VLVQVRTAIEKDEGQEWGVDHDHQHYYQTYQRGGVAEDGTGGERVQNGDGALERS
jgi:hypothetical protein